MFCSRTNALAINIDMICWYGMLQVLKPVLEVLLERWISMRYCTLPGNIPKWCNFAFAYAKLSFSILHLLEKSHFGLISPFYDHLLKKLVIFMLPFPGTAFSGPDFEGDDFIFASGDAFNGLVTGFFGDD